MGQFGFVDVEKRLAARETSTAARMRRCPLGITCRLWSSGLDVSSRDAPGPPGTQSMRKWCEQNPTQTLYNAAAAFVFQR
jgi:hypothetical protein